MLTAAFVLSAFFVVPGVLGASPAWGQWYAIISYPDKILLNASNSVVAKVGLAIQLALVDILVPTAANGTRNVFLLPHRLRRRPPPARPRFHHPQPKLRALPVLHQPAQLIIGSACGYYFNLCLLAVLLKLSSLMTVVTLIPKPVSTSTAPHLRPETLLVILHTLGGQLPAESIGLTLLRSPTITQLC
jgi:hypothetical protein